MNTIKMTMPRYLDDKCCLLKVETEIDQYVHQSWLLPEGQVISYENIPTNYPSGSLVVWESLEEYIDTIKDVEWINNENNILKQDEEILKPVGFPFNTEKDDE